MHRVLFIIIFCLCLCNCNAQTKIIDSLKTQIQNATSSQKKLQLIFLLGYQKQSLSTDTLYSYALQAKQIALKFNNKNDLLKIDFYLGNCLSKKGLLDSALKICDANIPKLKDDPSARNIYFDYLGFRAGLLLRSEKYKEAMDQYYFLLNNAERTQDTLNQISAKNGIGWVNMEMNQNREALNWFFKALNVSDNARFKIYYGLIYSNIAANYNTLHQNDSAEYFINKSILLGRQYENLTSLANALNIQGDIFIDTKREPLAEGSLTEALAIRKLIGDPYYIVSDLMQLAKLYANNSQTDKGIALCMEGISIAKKYNLTAKLLILYQALAENYKAANDQTKYAETLQDIINLKDSVYEKNSAEALADIQGKYEMQKKENIIIQQKLDIVSKNYLLYGALFILICGIIISILLFKNYRRKQAFILQSMREEEKRIAHQSIIEAEENERRRIAADLHDNMGAYATAIIADVDELAASENNEQSLSLENLKTNAGEIMSNLRDTIWASNKEKILLTGISDRFKNYIQKITPAYPNCKVEIIEEIENNISFPPVYALNIFRILQEGLTNALKHSGAALIQISFISRQNFKILISDNGKGINDVDQTKNGNGIKNMKSRAYESGYKLLVNKKDAGGTELAILN